MKKLDYQYKKNLKNQKIDYTNFNLTMHKSSKKYKIYCKNKLK